MDGVSAFDTVVTAEWAGPHKRALDESTWRELSLKFDEMV